MPRSAGGTLAASSLVIGALVALRFSIGLRPIGLVMAFGAGVLISAVSFDLIQEASDGWRRSRVLWMWIAIVAVSGIASLGGYALFQESSPDTVAVVLAFAAGAILTMLANTMMPEALEHSGKLVGVVTTLGFAVAYAIHSLA